MFIRKKSPIIPFLAASHAKDTMHQENSTCEPVFQVQERIDVCYCVLHTFWHHSCHTKVCTQRVSIEGEKGHTFRPAEPVGGVMK